MTSWPDPEFSRQLDKWRHIAKGRGLEITGLTWRNNHLSVDLAPPARSADIEARKPSPRSIAQGRLL